MIEILGSHLNQGTIDQQWVENPTTKKIVDTMRKSRAVYDFSSSEQLNFRLEMGTQIVTAARALNGSGVGFATFYTSRCNPQFWELTSDGGFRLNPGVAPSGALKDIFQNGRKYAFECATAMVIVMYRATLDSIGESAFNRYFSNLYLWDWEFDENLGLDWSVPVDYFPGDIRYFKNPDVNPLHMQWQGENVIDMGSGMFYGHGIGIRSAQAIIESLNRNRKPGSTESAYLMEEAGRPAFNELLGISANSGRGSSHRASDDVRNNFITVTVGDSVQVY